jgi:DNA-binding GntR family transcriptional regulator
MRTPQRVYDALKQMILGNELAPGAYVLHEELAQRLGVSRTPVREALIRLEQDGLVEIKPRHGMRVVPVSIEAMREIYEILTALEALAAELVARRGLSDAELTSLEATVDEMDAALARDDLETWAEADSLFHRLLVGFSGNGRLQAIVGTVVDQSHRVRRLTLRLRPKPVRSNSDHRAVVEAVRRRDPDTAYSVHHHHRQASGEMLIAILERLNLKVV